MQSVASINCILDTDLPSLLHLAYFSHILFSFSISRLHFEKTLIPPVIFTKSLTQSRLFSSQTFLISDIKIFGFISDSTAVVIEGSFFVFFYFLF